MKINTLLDNRNIKRLSRVEDRIEQKYKAKDILCCLHSIHKFFDKEKESKYQLSENIKKDFQNIFEELNKNNEISNAEPLSQVHADRDTIHEIVERIGTAATLLFVDTQLVVNIEKFFSGLVLSYMTIFCSTKSRSRIDATEVFNDREIEYHKEFETLRNTWYAHTEDEAGRHELTYIVSEGNIKFKENIYQSQPEYYTTYYNKLYICTEKLVLYIENDIKKQISKLEQNLSEQEVNKLIDNYNQKNRE